MINELLKRFISSIVLIPVLVLLILEGKILFNLFILILFSISVYEWHNLSKNKIYNIYGYLLIFFSFYSFYYLRNESELSFLFLILLICIFTDIGGYIFGKILKGPKLIKISPKKTYSGMIGSFVTPIILAPVYLNNLPTLNLPEYSAMKLNLVTLILLVSLISQVGDLIISLFKRKSNVKHTGKIIPGHGGLLDRIDGMLFVFPFVFIFLKIL